MTLSDWYDSLPDEEKQYRFGVKTDDPLTKSFPRKRVVHAGLDGEIIPPDESQRIWDALMAQAPKGNLTQTAYIHIPFCKTKCLYCPFFQNGTRQEDEDRYVDCLVKELEMSADAPRMKNGLIHAVFIGGGTPTSLSPFNARRMFDAIRRCLPLANDCELTLEGRVNDLTEEKMETWLDCGVNRMSLGVQSFHTQIRRRIGRIDDGETVLKNLSALKSYNQCVVVVDLMYGLPGQNLKNWEEDLQILIDSGVDGADLYQLNVFDGSDLNQAIRAGRLPPAASTEEQARLFAFARDFLDKREWRRLNICHWSRSNRERSLYNCLARSGAPMFPFGCGAGGTVDGYATMLHRSLMPYEMYVDAGKKPFMGLMKQTPLQPLADVVHTETEQGYLRLGDLARLDSRMEELRWLCDFWEERGLMRNNGVLYTLTEAGQFWQVNMAQTALECIRYLVTGESALAIESVAAQDSGRNPKVEEAVRRMQAMKGKKKGLMAMKEMAEAMRKMSPSDIRAVMERMRELKNQNHT